MIKKLFFIILFLFLAPVTADAITLISTSQNTLTTDGTSLAVDKPAGVQDNDVLIAHFSTDGDNVGTPPGGGGWTEIFQGSNGTVSYTGTWYKVITNAAGEPGSYTWTFSSSEQIAGAITNWRGVDTTAPINAYSPANTGISGSPTALSTTTYVDGCQILAVVGIDQNRTFTPPGDMTEQYDFSAGTILGCAQTMADMNQASAGATGDKVFTASASDNWVAGLIALTPAEPTITITSSINQPSSVLLDTTNNVMGSVSVAHSVSTDTVTAVTLKENGGTIDAQNELANVELWLSSDDTWDSGDNRLDVAKSFDGADGECTFTEAFQVATTTQYLIVRLDVLSSATTGHTIEIQVSTMTASDPVNGIPCDITGTTTVNLPSITVASSIAQPLHAAAGCTDKVMGVASIIRDGGTGQVTAVTLKENGGTIDAQNELSNIELWLSSDTDWDSGDEQLDTTKSFNGADGECTFTENFDVTVSTQYLIIRLDVASGATVNDTIEVRISTITTSDTVNGAPCDISGTTTVTSDWWNASWSHRKELSFDNTAQTENLTYFPVMVKLTPSRINYSDFGKSDGTDLRFIDSDNSTELKYHIEKWNSSGDSFIWVRVPQIDGSSKLDFIYMYYGNSGASDVQDSSSTFSNSYRAVWHMAEDLWNGTSDEVKDSTVNEIHGTRGGDATTTDTGKIGRCGTFDGTGDYVDLGTDVLRYTVGTLSAWVNFSASDIYAIVSVHEGIDTYDWSNLRIGSGALQYYCRVGSTYKVGVVSDETMTPGVWNYVAYATDSSGNQLYINGEPADATYSYGDSTTNAFFGDIPSNQNTKIGILYDYNGSGAVTNQYSGTMDEVRFSTACRSGDWIRAQYKSMTDSFINWPAFINVVSSTAQPSSVAQGCVDKVIGSVSIGKSVGSGTVTAVTLKENGGSIDAQNELSNIELWLSSNDTWDPGDNRLDTAKNFNGADGECTFNEGFVVTSSNQYLIVRLDVSSEATVDDTIEIQVKSITTTDDVDGTPCDISGTSSVVAPSITVAACISQPTYAVIPSTNNIMGVASIVRTGGTSQVTAVTLKENGGTIDAQNELENIELWLSSDTIWGADDEQLDTAKSFNGADGECTFTETFDVTTTAQYLIPRLDVASGATSGDTIEICISTITTTDSVGGIPLDFTGYTTTDNSGTLPDFTLTSSDISFSTHPHKEGQDISITAVILNDGASYGSSINVDFYDGDPDISGTKINDTQTIASLDSGTTAQVQVTWTCTYGGDHDIFVHIDRENSIGEARDNNNKAYKTITVGAANYWISDTAGNWSNASNWSLGAKPVQGDYIVFNSLHTGKCTIDENTPALGRILIDFGAGEIVQNGNVTITGDYIQSEGKFTCSAPQTYSFSAGGDFSIPTISDAFRRASGSGTLASPYKIYDVYGLQALQCGSDSYFELGNNIDAGPSSNWDSGKGFRPVTFTGTFDGKNHTITDIYINRPSSDCQGLFATISADATVKNLGLIDAEVHGAKYTGTLAGVVYGTIINCYSENAQVSGTGQGVGGLVGYATGSSASISKCYTTGSVDGTDQEQVGGLVGLVQNGAYISNSYSHASVTGYWKVGGLCGRLTGTLSKCYSTGSVSWDNDGGGFNGFRESPWTIEYCYWDTQTSGQSTSNGGTGKTTAEMKQQATFVTWDFTSIWSIIQNQTYPYLRASGIVWDGGGANNNWSTGANWVGDTVPGETDNVLFNATSNKPCTINTSATVTNFSIVEGSTITITASANLTVTGNFSLSTGTFNAGSTNLTIGGDWSLTTDSTFNAQTSTVTFNSLATAELIGNTTFYCLKSTQTFKTIKFSSSSITYVTGHLNFENITLRSTLDGATWYLNLSGTQDVHDVDVQDSNASGSTINATDSTDSGNNTNWNFGPPAGANRYWVGVTDPDTWNDPNNWSATSGGTGGVGVPGPDDTAIFDGGNIYSCQIDISSTVASVIIYSTYTATISINSGKSLTTSGSFEIAGGTFTTNGEILDVGSYNQTGGIFNAGGSTVTCNGDFSVTVGTFNAGASVLILDGTDGDATFTGGGYTFNNVIFQSTGTVARTWTLGGGTITFNGNFQLKAQGSENLTVTANTNNPDLDIGGSVDYTGTGAGTELVSMGDGTWTVGGNVDFSGGTVDESTSTFVLNGTSTQTLTMDGNSLNILQITNSSSGVYFADNLTLSTFTAITENTRLYFCGGSTFTFTNINFNGQSESSRIVLKSTSTGTAWYLTVTGNQSVSYVDVRDSDASGGNTIDADDGTNKDSGNNVNWDFEAPGDRYWVASSAGNWKDPDNWSTSSGGAPPATVPSSSNKAIFDGAGLGNCSIDIDASVTDVVIYSTYTATVSINTSQSLTTSSSFSIAGGTFTTNGEILDVGSYNQTGGIFNAGGSTVTCNGDFSVTIGAFNAGASILVLDATDGTKDLITEGTGAFNNLQVNAPGATIELEDDLDMDGNLTISAGTLDTKSGENNPIYVAGNWTFEGGTFECRSSTVTFDNASSTSTLTGSTTFYALVSTETAKTIKFSSTTITYVIGHLNFEDVILRSTLDNATWYLNLSGTQYVSDVDVQDSNASGGSTIYALGVSTDSGNNTNWNFALGPPPGNPQIPAVYISSITVTWEVPDPQPTDGYVVEASTESGFDPIWASSDTADGSTTTLTVFNPALDPNTTYYLRVGSLWDGGATTSYAATEPSTSTLASVPTAHAVSPFQDVFVSSITARWDSGTPANPENITLYTVEASTADDFTGTVYSSQTYNLYATADTLESNTTYYFRVKATNHNGIDTEYLDPLGSTSTLAQVVTGATIYAVFVTSVTANWQPLEAGEAEGYVLEASTKSNFVPVWASSTSIGVELSTLTVTGLVRETTYYFRVASLNWNNVPNYKFIGSTKTIFGPMEIVWDGEAADNNWYTSTNWDPDIVPTSVDTVTIALNGANVSAAGTSISFSSMSLGNVGGNTVSLTISTTIVNAGNLIIYNNAGLTFGTTFQSTLNNLTIKNGGNITHIGNSTSYSVNLLVKKDMFIDSTGSINVNSKGYSGGLDNGTGTGKGYLDDYCGGGGGYGGNGGRGSTAGSSGGITYGSLTQPSDIGSSGAGGHVDGWTGGTGGGAVNLVVVGTFTLNGSITTNGGNGIAGGGVTRHPGGGSGGSVYISVGTLEGSGGSITANGGNALNSGGGGGGGRIAIEYTEDNSSLTLQAYGGSVGYQKGGAGTIYLKGTAATNGDLIVDNGTVNGVNTTQIDSSNYSFENLTIKNYAKYAILSGSTLTVAGNFTDGTSNASLTINGNLDFPSGTYTLTGGSNSPGTITNNGSIDTLTNLSVLSLTFFQNGTFSALTDLTIGSGATFEFQNLNTATSFTLDNLTIQNGGTLTHKANPAAQTYILNLVINNDMALDSGGSIDVNSKGHPGGQWNGTGDGAGGNGNYRGGGAGYGGTGGQGNDAGATGGVTYGSLTEPTNIGSGGGGGSSAGWIGGTGGGAVKLQVSGTFTFDDSITANGGNGLDGGGLTRHPGGGSGGSVYISAGILEGSLGSIAVKGGNGLNQGGGGAGGRVHVCAATNNFAGTVNVDGGTGYNNGNPGTIVSITTLKNHDKGQFSDVYISTDAIKRDIFRFEIETSSGGVVIDTITFNLSDVTGIVSGDFDVSLVEDEDKDGIISSTETTTVGGTGAVTVWVDSGTIKFSENFNVPGLSEVAYILISTVSNLGGGDKMTVSLSSTNLIDRCPAHLNKRGILTGSVSSVTYTAIAPPSNPTILDVFVSSISVTYGLVGADGYVVDASTESDFDPIWSSSSSSVAVSTLAPQSLDPNTTYYLRAGALWGTTTSYADTTPVSTCTLADLVSGATIYAVFVTSVTANWQPLEAGEAKGYVLEASTESNFVPVWASSTSIGVELSTLTVTGLVRETTYYFRVGSLNWNNVPNYKFIGSTKTIFGPMEIVWDGEAADNNWSTGANWDGDIVPSENDDVVFDNTSSKACTIDILTTVASFSIQTGSTITITASGNLTVTGDFSLSTGTFNAGSTLLTVGANWSVAGDATFNCQTSTVTFTNASSTSTFTGSTTFYALVSTETAKTIKFSSNTITYVTGHLNFENVILRSTLDNATWYLNLSGTQDVSGVDVQDSNASGGTTVAAGASSTNSGNNTNWDFGPPAAITDLTGLCNSDTGEVTLSWSTPGDDDWTGTLPSGSEYIIDYSTYSIAWSTSTYDVEISTSGVAPYTQVSHTITGLTGDSTYYFRIWTRDEVPTNWSGLSNGATIWVNPILSVTIEPSTRAFGEVPANQSDVLTDGFTVENAGNITQKYQLRLTGVPTGWTAKNVAGAPEWEQAKILGLFTTQSPLETTHFNDNSPDTGDGDIVRSTNDDQATGTNFAISEEGVEVKGYNVTVGGIRYLWFRFDAPSGTSITTEQFLTVTVTAIQQ